MRTGEPLRLDTALRLDAPLRLDAALPLRERPLCERERERERDPMKTSGVILVNIGEIYI